MTIRRIAAALIGVSLALGAGVAASSAAQASVQLTGPYAVAVELSGPSEQTYGTAFPITITAQVSAAYDWMNPDQYEDLTYSAGSIRFSKGAATLKVVPLDDHGRAKFTLKSDSIPGSKTLTATFVPDDSPTEWDLKNAYASKKLYVHAIESTTVVSSNKKTQKHGGAGATITASVDYVNSKKAPLGTVTFSVNGVQKKVVTVDAEGKAKYTLSSSTPVGEAKVKAVFKSTTPQGRLGSQGTVQVTVHN